MRMPSHYRAFDPVDRIVLALQDAALDDAHWPRAGALIDDACRTHGSHLVVADTSACSPEYLHGHCFRHGASLHALERDYALHYFATDERIARLLLLPAGSWLSNPELYTDRELVTSATYNEFLPRLGSANQLVVRLHGLGDSHVFWTVTRLTSQGDWRASELRVLGRLLPHVRHAVRVRQALARAETERRPRASAAGESTPAKRRGRYPRSAPQA